MNYLQYYPIDVVNGEGTRCTLFVSGCEHRCQGCHNATTWDARKGTPFDQAMEDRIIADLGDSRIKRDGLSLSGGDPLFPGNLSGILKLVQRVKAEYPQKNIWLWTGYTLEELSQAQQEVVQYIDVLIDGRFELDKRDLSLPWRGSNNQRIIYINNTPRQIT
ncbi:anaerobic ribonucleoside-triphosphate reductase-activating protein [Endozoicomonas sp. GU-1]|uniref:anaerobic ribonucleoside-triphosphate reductase-activating protein n=1 Tax=Endozoicomonas sp. GU-1 TaxID=3009078 RepID=UPI0022B5D982|nr:anaerobic ribonucleoside-triphosphate reductase-activating protein [Endozoicomonas sp. GU-1]WBA85785.1 anaerobic ribonucleoside-triphosphate reductase-activating protein [Endozoicomonas sp. GU-1]